MLTRSHRSFLVVVLILTVARYTCAQTYEVRHVAGSPGGLGRADGGGAAARFSYPWGIAGDATYLYVADQFRIRRITVQTGEVIAIAGNASISGETDGIGTEARFVAASALWKIGNVLYIADNGRIRRMDLPTGDVRTILRPVPAEPPQFRTPISLWSDEQALYFAEAELPSLRGSATAGDVWRFDLTTNQLARLSVPLPAGITYGSPTRIYGDGRELFIIYDYAGISAAGAFIVSYNLNTGATRLIADSGLQSERLREPGGLWAGGDGFLYVSDPYDFVIYRVSVSKGEIETILGKQKYRGWVDGVGTAARFRSPFQIWGDRTNLYIGDAGNYSIRAANLSTLAVTTLAGSGVRYTAPDDTPRQSFAFGISNDTANLYFSTGDTIQRMPLSGGDATVLARFRTIYSTVGIWSDGSYIYAVDPIDLVIRKIDIATREMTILAAASRNSHGIWGDGTNLYVSDALYIHRIVIATGEDTIIAGGPTIGSEDGIGLNARFRGPKGIWGDGNFLYIVDSANRTIRKMSLATYEVTTIAGRGFVDGVLDERSADGIGSDARFVFPEGVWGDGANLYVTDGTRTIRKINLGTREVTTIAGTQAIGNSEDGIGSVAHFDGAAGILGIGNLLYITDGLRLRTLDIPTRRVTTLVGRVSLQVDGVGMNAQVSGPSGFWGDGTTLYFTDYSALRKLDLVTQQITTLAGWPGESGKSDGVGSVARFNGPAGICSDGRYLYVAEFENHMIRRVVIGSWEVTRFSGTGVIGAADGAGDAAQFYKPAGIWCEQNYVYVADYGNRRLRRITIATREVTTLITELAIGLGNLWGDQRYLYIGNGLNKTIDRYEFVTGSLTRFAGPFPSGDQYAAVNHLWGDGSNLYVSYRHAIRRVNLETGESSVIAGDENAPGSEDGIGTSARLYYPGALWADGANLYVAEAANHAIRSVNIASPASSSLSFNVAPLRAISRATAGNAPSVAVG